MKLATLKNNTPDGQLLVVNRNLERAVSATAIAPTLQAALDDWVRCAPALHTLYETLNENSASGSFGLDVTQLAAPLPRAYQWADGSAYVNHVELVRKARGAKMPASFWTDPLLYQGGSDTFLGPSDDIVLSDEAWGIDFEAEIAVITDRVKMGVTSEQAGETIALLMLVNDVSLRNLVPAELAKNFGFFQSKPSCAFSPVAVTPDELGQAWEHSKVHLPLITHYNDNLFGQPQAGEDMTFNFSELVAHAAKTRVLSAGTIIGSGTVSNLDRTRGSSCIAEKRMLEIIEKGKPTTAFMQFGDSVRIEMLDKQNNSIFGAINQRVAPYNELS